VAAGNADLNPLFAELAGKTGQPPKWNFHKYVIARDGQTVKSFPSDIEPGSPAFVQTIEKLLSEQ
jgi:glutathione peroxidase